MMHFAMDAMGSHPIPQNVTSFEFHLVGDMTLKQFAYLAIGLAIAYGTFTFIFPVNALVAIPIITVSALTGAAFAFLPIAGRPLDHWLKTYLHSITAPTQGVWQSPVQKNKNSKIDPKDPIFTNRLQLFLSTVNFDSPPQATPAPTQPTSVLPTSPVQPFAMMVHDFKDAFEEIESRLAKKSSEEKPPAAVQSQPKTVTPQPKIVQPTTTPTLVQAKVVKVTGKPKEELPSEEELNKLVEVAKNIQVLRSKAEEAEQQLNQLKTATVAPNIPPQKAQAAYQNLQALVRETEDIYRQSQVVMKQAPVAHPAHVVVVKPTKPQVKEVTLTSTPNVINGVITDNQGNLLDNVVVIIHNKEGLPVRALKTNKLGQFTGATPLDTDVYKVTIEKDDYEFDALEVTLTGEVIAPIKVTGKKIA